MRSSDPNGRAVGGRVLLVFAVPALAIIGYLIWRYARSSNSTGRLGLANLAPHVKYVGDQICANCHRSIAHSYGRTAMGRSWRRPETADLIEDYSGTHEVWSEVDGYRYQVYREGDQFFQREYRVDSEGEVTYSQVRQVAYVLGSGTRGRSYVTDSDGYLTVMPVAWYTKAGQWDMSPSYRRTNQRFSRPILTQCMGCHNSYPDYVAGSSNRYRHPLPEGIGCERCHGPGELHVERQEASRGSTGSRGPDPTIVNPARLPVDLQQDVCLQCHLTTLISFPRSGEPFEFRPGQRLSDFRADFMPGGAQIPGFAAVSHGTRTALSRCFTESQRKMTCVYCHDPHVPTSEIGRDYFNERCTSCHESDACNRTESVGEMEEAHRSNDCVVCHMPKREPMDIEHTVTTDHWIRRRSSLPPSSLNMEQRSIVEFHDFFDTAEGGELGIAHVMFGSSANRPDSINQGVVRLREALTDEPDDVRWQAWLGFALQRLGRQVEAARIMERASRQLREEKGRSLTEPERISLLFELAQLMRQLGQPRQALEVIDQLLASAPDYVPGYELAAAVNLSLKRPEAATHAIREGLERDPTMPNLWLLLAHHQLDVENDPEAAMASLTRARELDPLLPGSEELSRKVKTRMVERSPE